jgi:outer membrane protein insertion porin family
MTNNFERFRVSAVTAIVASAFAVSNAWAVDPFTVRDIRVEGLQRVEPGTIFASIPVRVGDLYNDDKGTASIRSLFALGLFKDVRLETNGDVLVVIVEERPTVADMEFVGAKEFEKDVLKKALRDVGLTDGRAFDKALADRAEQELKRQYVNRSLYAAEVVTTVTPIERNRVNLTFTVTEGNPARIKDIRIVGGKAVSESTLRSEIELSSGGWFTWYTKSDRYSRAKLNADLETLRSYYLNRGYIDFRIDSTQVAISPNKEDISITVNITEGERFVVSGVKLQGNYLGKENDFKTFVKIEAGQPYNAEQVTQTTKAFTDYFGKFGFAFARVEARPELDRETNQVNLVLMADPSRRAYVRKINVTGNSRTRDEVIRREFRQFESAWYDGDRIKLSRDRIDRLGYFRDVNMETEEVPGAPDQVDVTVNVAEKPTGSVQLGAGFSSYEKLALSFGIKQENAFGSGNYLGLDVNTSKFNRVLVLSTTDPYFTQDGVSRTIDAYYRSSRPYTDQGGNYQLVTAGSSIRFGVPFTEVDRVFFGAGVEQTQIRPGTNIPAAYLAYATKFGYTSSAVPLTIGWARDSRDSALAPSSGQYQRVGTEMSAFSDAQYLRTNYQFQQYIPITKVWTTAFNAEFGWGKGLGNRPFPVFKNFYSGGLGSVRGFEQSTLGPRDVTGSVIGGAKKVTFNAEVIGPFPGTGNDRTLRWYGFADAGNVFGDGDKIQVKDLRASVGVGLSWVSPIGPLRLAFANPIKKQAGDRIQKLQFQIGTSF